MLKQNHKADPTMDQLLDIPKSPVKFFWFVSKPQMFWMVLAMLVVVITSAAGQATSYFFKWIVEAAQENNTSLVILLGLLYPCVVFIIEVSYRLGGLLVRNWSLNAEKFTYDLLTEHVMQHSHGYFSDRFAGSILTKINNVVSAIQQSIPDLVWAQLSTLVTLLVTLVILFITHPPTAFTFLILLVVLLIVNKALVPKRVQLSKESSLAGSNLSGGIVDMLTNIQAVRQYSRYTTEKLNINHLSEKYREAGYQSWGFGEIMMIINSFILFIFSVVMFWFLTQAWKSEMITTGDFVLVIGLYAQIVGTLIFIGRAFNTIAKAWGQLQEGLGDILVPFEVENKPNAKKLQIDEAKIYWHHVTFQFGENKVFNDFNLTILPGQRIGLVGPSGAGKSTFVSLLLRQHDIDSGEILIDGQNIAEVTQDSLRQAVAVVPQEPLLFHRSIRENIAYGKPKATKKEMIEVAKKAQALEFIESLPEGFETMVGERGVKLSGGQKQRVAIARAMLKNAPILVLDEATSALDSESEVAIQKALHQLMVGKTVIAIAHRLSTLREMDRIIVMDKGKIVEDGSHGALLEYGGIYAKLWTHQAGGFLQE